MDLYGYISTDKKILDLCEIILQWKKLNNQLLYPDDILNYLIDLNIITVEEVLKLKEESDHKPINVCLPKKHI